MKTLLMILLAVVSLATSACTTTFEQGYGYGSASVSYSTGYTQPVYNQCEPREVYIARPPYYRTSIPYFRGNMINYTGVPIIAPSVCHPRTNVIIPNSWN